MTLIEKQNINKLQHELYKAFMRNHPNAFDGTFQREIYCYRFQQGNKVEHHIMTRKTHVNTNTLRKLGFDTEQAIDITLIFVINRQTQKITIEV